MTISSEVQQDQTFDDFVIEVVLWQVCASLCRDMSGAISRPRQTRVCVKLQQ